jgi:hypothetical protein
MWFLLQGPGVLISTFSEAQLDKCLTTFFSSDEVE